MKKFKWLVLHMHNNVERIKYDDVNNWSISLANNYLTKYSVFIFA